MSLLESITSEASPEYSTFLRKHSESISIGDFVLMYGQDDVAERNETLEVQTYLSGWVAIGDDGGGTAILMRLDGSPSVYRCGHGVIGSITPEQIADSFANWLSEGCSAPWVNEDDGYDEE